MKRTLSYPLAAVVGAVLALSGPALGAGKGTAKGKTKPCRATVAYVLEGRAVSVGADSVTLAVAGTNRHARAFAGQDVTLAATAATKVSRDEERAVASDLAPEDFLTAMLRGCKDADPATVPLVAHHIAAVSPAPDGEPVPVEDESELDS